MASKLRAFGTEISRNRRLNSELSKEVRSAIISAQFAGEKKAQLARDFGVHRNTINRTLDRWQHHHTLKSLPRTGRPQVLSPRQIRLILRIVRKDPKIKWKSLRNELPFEVTIRTLQTVLQRQFDLRKWRSPRRPSLDESDARQRYAHCKAWRPREQELVEYTIYSDECSIQNDPNGGVGWVFRYGHEKFRKDLVNRTQQAASLSFIVYAWIRKGPGGKSPLVFMERDPQAPRGCYSSQSYIMALDQVLRSQYRRHRGQRFLYQQDNARIHTSRATKEWFRAWGVPVIDWPPYSPDFNPIEHIWKRLKDLIYELHPQFADLKDKEVDRATAKEWILDAWEHVDQGFIDSLLDSVPRRRKAVREARRWYTKY
ncbi:DDE superfamily endonuclease-domain-containing protein [Rhypophila decipiens]|uniref:DDE superfamily endonuclease-domain-containing protein n=1 Tax=Rhypophila decipiens TaxID=261697 RepID=A0AAN6XWS8_9PEZI|nr:DDE superfamily endonuclease-domain-containing protein [Rhypophila decipiens]